jgi:hypothetical protein
VPIRRKPDYRLKQAQPQSLSTWLPTFADAIEKGRKRFG